MFQNFALRAAPATFPFHPKNASSDMRGKRRGVYAGLGVVPGIPDLVVFQYHGVHGDQRYCRVYALELKRASRKGRKRTPHELKQQACREAMERCGAVTGEAFGIDEALEWLENQGLLRGTKC